MRIDISHKTLAQLRAFTAEDVRKNRTVYLTDEGKEGEFVYDSSDTTSADNIGTVLVAGTARYKRVFDEYVEPSWFYTSGSYSTAIQTALTIGKKVFIKNGTYLIDTSINVPSNSFIVGEGKNTIIKLNANNLKAFNISSSIKSNITISDLSIDGSGQTTNVFTGVRNSFGVYATNVTNLNLKNLYIYKMGVVNQSNVIDDNDQANGFANPTGGYGILVEAREGIIENVLIENCKIENIAGGGNIFGDGICVQGFNTNLNIIPKNIIIKDCYANEVARHCYSVAGGGAESLGNDVKIINCFGKNAALCGVDIEDGNNVIIENSNFETCGITNTYYNPTTVYGATYNLRAGISYANTSNYLSFTNVKIKNSYYGLTVGAGGNILVDNLTVEGSVTKDIELGLARWGENITIRNSKFLSNTTNSFNLFNSSFNSFIKFENCFFIKSPIVAEVFNVTFDNCIFNEKLTFTATGAKRIKILNNTFNGSRGLETLAISQFIEEVEILNNTFNTSLQGIYVLYDSFVGASIIGNTFKGGIGIYHLNANGNTPFSIISENKFIGCTTGIDINQGIKDAIISKNLFKNISNWCINIHDIITDSPTDVPFTNNIISHNIADNTCVNGLQVYGSTGKILNSIFNYNLFNKCTNVDYNIIADFIDDISQIWKKSPIVSFTINEVRAFKNSDVQSNKTLFIKDSGKEGFWEFDSTDGSSTDNLGTVLVTTSNARYKRVFDGAVRPEWFGALGDGTTNDTTALQAAFNLQKDVSISKGTYLVNGEIEIFGNVYCEKDAIFKIADGYSGNLFKVRAKKRLVLDNLYIDAIGSTNDPTSATNPNITCKGLYVEGLWLSTINNFSMFSHEDSTSNVGIDLVSSPASGQPFGLAFGVYCVDINNPNISRGGIGIRTNKQTSETDNFFTHLSIRSGWVTEQETYNFHLQYAYQTIIENVATDTIKLNTGVGYKIANSNQMNLLLGEYNVEPDTPDTALLIDIDDATCSFIDIVASRSIKPVLINGKNFTLRSANTLRFRPTTANGYYTEIRAAYSYGEPFVIEGNFDGGGALRKILKYDNTNFLTTEGNLIKTSKPRVQNVTSSSTLTPNSTNDEVVNITVLATNVTIAAPSGTPVNGQEIKFRITDDATPRTITWNSIYRGVGLTLPSTTASLVPLYIEAVYNSWDVKWDVVRVSSGSIQFTGIQLNAGSAPSSPVNGYMYYDSSTNKFRGYANGAWVDLH